MTSSPPLKKPADSGRVGHLLMCFMAWYLPQSLFQASNQKQLFKKPLDIWANEPETLKS